LSVAADVKGRIYSVVIPKPEKVEEYGISRSAISLGHDTDASHYYNQDSKVRGSDPSSLLPPAPAPSAGTLQRLLGLMTKHPRPSASSTRLPVTHLVITNPSNKDSYLGPCEVIGAPNGDLWFYRTPQFADSPGFGDGRDTQRLYRIAAAQLDAGPRALSPADESRMPDNPELRWIAEPFELDGLPRGAVLTSMGYVPGDSVGDAPTLLLSYRDTTGAFWKSMPAGSDEWSEPVRHSQPYSFTRNAGLPVGDPAHPFDPDQPFSQTHYRNPVVGVAELLNFIAAMGKLPVGVVQSRLVPW
jgi:hypothetical protein